jgi:hypothetical protein
VHCAQIAEMEYNQKDTQSRDLSKAVDLTIDFAMEKTVSMRLRSVDC